MIRKIRKRKATNATETAKRKAWGRQWGGAYHAEKLAGRWGGK